MKRHGAAAVQTSSQHSDLWTLVERRAVDHAAARLAIDESGRTLTFSALQGKADRVAAGLTARGVTSGTRVTWQLPNSLDAIVLIAALSRIGAVQNPVLPLYGRRELTFICEQFDPHLLIVPAQWRGVDYAATGRSLTEGAERDLFVLDGELPEGEPLTGPARGGVGDEPTFAGSSTPRAPAGSPRACATPTPPLPSLRRPCATGSR